MTIVKGKILIIFLYVYLKIIKQMIIFFILKLKLSHKEFHYLNDGTKFLS